MSQQHNPTPPRRNFLKKTLALIPLAAAGSSILALDAKAAPAAGVADHYVPVYFNADEWRFLLAACDRLIPTDDNGPGAVDQGVPVFIDRQMEAPYGHGGLW
ncbi:Gluconate 2-dehydrogenase subunit 3 precursor [Serratia quinivorans]|nr:Gluconate 2-dehydrogenase subunit 3 precursor [Serratia quinivorans]